VKRVVLLVLGGLALLVAMACVGGGSLLIVASPDDGWDDSGRKRVTTPGHAFVVRTSEIARRLPLGEGELGEKLRFAASSSDAGRPLFVGIGSTVDVQRYLAGASVDEVVDLPWSGGGLGTIRVAGALAPDPPDLTPIWVASAVGSGRVELEWTVRQGAFQLVVMNADAMAGLEAEGSFGVRDPFVRPFGIALVVVGALALVVGVVLLVLGALAKRDPPAGPWAPGWVSPGARAEPGSWSPPGTWGSPWAPPWGNGAPDDIPSAPWTRAQRP